MTNPTVSIVVVTYRTGSALWICLYRLLQLRGLYEIIVVNNGNDAVVEAHLRKLEQRHPPLRYITGQGNVGFATACNIGAKAATGDFIMLLNPDAVMMEDDALLRITALFARKDLVPPVGLVGGVLRNEDGSEQRATRRHFLTPQNALVEGLGLHRISGLNFLPRLNVDKEPLPVQPAPIDAISGACMVMERERYAMLHGMDENYFLHVEDMDLCRRVHLAGGGVWIHPGVNILHYCSTSEVSSIVVERSKTAGFYRYFNTHFQSSYVWRPLAVGAATLRLGLRILASFGENGKNAPQLTHAIGLRRVQAIIRGVEATLEALRNKEPSPIPPGSTVLVTGASSAIGSFAIGRLLTYGCKIVAVQHSTLAGFFHPNLSWVEGDLTKPETLAAALSGRKCDYVLHCAPIWHASKLTQVLKSAGVKRVVAISSTSIISKQGSESEYERRTVERLAQGEQLLTREAESAGVEWTIIRPTMVYGAGLDENITRIAHIIDRKRRFVLPKDAMGKRSPVHADDLALAAINALGREVARNKVYTLQGGEVLPYHKMVAQIFKTMRVYPKILVIPGLEAICAKLHPLLPRLVPHQAVALRMRQDLIFDDSAARTDLGITPRPFLRDGICDLGVCEEVICRSLLPV